MNPTLMRMVDRWAAGVIEQQGLDAYTQLVRTHGREITQAFEEAFVLARDAAPPRETNERLHANAEALKVLGGKQKFDDSDLVALKNYTGWGGLPRDILEQLDLLEHTPPDEYYTPPQVSASLGQAVAPLLPALVGRDGRITALEPSAGVGRLIAGIESGTELSIDWTAVELSPVSAKILETLWPEVNVQRTSFEKWIVDHSSEYQGRLKLVVCNPPFSGRGPTASIDKSFEYDEPDNYGYFMRRALDLLAPGGLGVFIAPKYFLERKKDYGLRRKILQRHRLCAAFGLPRNAFAAVNLCTSILIFRARGGELTEATPEDRVILEGRYFEQNPEHSLKFDEERNIHIPVMTPECAACLIGKSEDCAYSQAPSGTAVEIVSGFGHRIADFRTRLEAGDPLSRNLWRELSEDLKSFRESDYLKQLGGEPNPWAWTALQRASDDDGVAAYLSAFDEQGTSAAWLTEEPNLAKHYRGSTRSVVDQANWLYKHNGERALHLHELLAFHKAIGGNRTPKKLQKQLLDGGWVVSRPGVVEPAEVYFHGDLLGKLQHLQITPETRSQAEQLKIQTHPIPLEDVDVSPRHGWIPPETLSAWVSEILGTKVELDREAGVVVASGEVDDQLQPLLGWLNHDNTKFSPRTAPKVSREPSDEALKGVELNRTLWTRYWIRHFQAWATADAPRRFALAEEYNRASRGYRCRENYPTEPLAIPRWGSEITLHPFQVAAARRLLDQHQGLLALDTGLGKTYVGLAVLAAARSRGLARRPVVVVPKSLAWKWFDAFKTALPDYRVVVIGSVRYRRTSGKKYKQLKQLQRDGKLTKAQLEATLITSRNDKPEDRAEKWAAFAAAAYDAVIVTTSAMAETCVSGAVLESWNSEPAVARFARQSKKIETPQGDAGGPPWVADFLLVDEAARFKNLWTPEIKLKYMGCPPPSRRALQLDLRAHATRMANGERGGVVLLSATPAKNSPVELYNLGHITDPNIWKRAGIFHASQFAERYIASESVPTLCPDLDVKVHPAVVGFQNMDELRGLLCRFSEFKTATEIDTDLKLPSPRRHIVEVELDERQKAKYDALLGNLPEKLEDPCGALAILVKLGLVAVHGNLDEGYSWDNFEGVDPQSPKFAAIAARVVAITNCGHLVFVQNHAAQRWLRQVLVDAGVPAERIAILNAKVPNGELKRIAQGFNGDDPNLGVQYDVLIVNEVAYEGLDLQTRTCAVHHADLPWNSAELQQRIGRAIRPGAKCQVVEVFYYVALGSTDRHRLAMIDGKARWDKDINKGDTKLRNPLAAVFEDPLEVLLSLAGDDASIELIEKARERKRVTDKRRVLVAANRLAYRAAARYRDVREAGSNSRLASVRLKEADALVRELNKIDPKVWPWAKWLGPIRDVMPLVPRDGSAPVFEGLRVTRLVRKGELEAFEFGRTGYEDGSEVIGFRRAGEGVWTRIDADDVAKLGIRARHLPGETEVEWPADLGDTVGHIHENLENSGVTSWPELFGWKYASATFTEWIWPRVAHAVTKSLRRDTNHAFPALDGEGVRLVSGAKLIGVELIPPTLAGWSVFLKAIEQTDGVEWDELEQVADVWWGRKLPERSS